MADHLERMQTLELITLNLTSTPREANKLAFDLTELEDASEDVAKQIAVLRSRAIEHTAVTRVDLMQLLAHLSHWRGHERQIRNVIDRAIDQMPNPNQEDE